MSNSSTKTRVCHLWDVELERELGFSSIHVAPEQSVLLILIQHLLSAVVGLLPVESVEDLHVLPRDSFILSPLGDASHLLNSRLFFALSLLSLVVKTTGAFV